MEHQSIAETLGIFLKGKNQSKTKKNPETKLLHMPIKKVLTEVSPVQRELWWLRYFSRVMISSEMWYEQVSFSFYCLPREEQLQQQSHGKAPPAALARRTRAAAPSHQEALRPTPSAALLQNDFWHAALQRLLIKGIKRLFCPMLPDSSNCSSREGPKPHQL